MNVFIFWLALGFSYAQKMNVFIFWLALGFSYAQKLSSRLSSYRRRLFVIVVKPVRPLGCKG